MDQSRRQKRFILKICNIDFIQTDNHFFPIFKRKRQSTSSHFIENTAKRPNVIFLVMHFDGLRRRVVKRYLTTLHIFTLLKNNCSPKIAYFNLIILCKKYILRPNIVMNYIFLLVKIVNPLGYLQSILSDLLNRHFFVNESSKITIFAVLKHKIEVYFIRKCIL